MPDFSALSSAYSALASHRRRTEVIGQNIANVDTPGYSRLRAELTSYNGTGAIGVFAGTGLRTGVDVASITRMKDEVLEQQARISSSRSSALNEQARALSQVEQRLDALGPDSLSAQLEALWNGFADLANDPGAMAPRQAIIQLADRVATTLNELHAGTVSQRAAEQRTLQIKVDEVNDLATNIAVLQRSITAAHAAGSPATDLLDQQDRMVNRLSELVDLQVTKRPDGTVNLYVDGHDLVSEQIAKPLDLQPGGAIGHGLFELQIVARSSGRALEITGGEIGGLRAVVNHELPAHLTLLDQVANNLAITVNGIHSAGRGLVDATGRVLFTGTTAGNLAVNTELVGEPRHLAAAGATDGPLGTATARLLAGLGDDPVANPAIAFERMASALGAQVASLKSRATAAGAATQRAQSARDAVSGVSLDEELTNLIESQRSYESAARLLTTIDQMLDTLINRTGLVGR